MVNNEQENYTEEHQEESWFAKNKTMVLGIGALVVLLGFWAFSNSNKESAAPVAPQSTSTVGTYWNRAWNYVSKEKPTWLHLGIAAAVVAGATAGLKRSKWAENMVTKAKKWWKNEPKTAEQLEKELKELEKTGTGE